MRCLIVDDSAYFVDAARGLLERQGMTVVGVASTSAEALRRFEELRPDVTLVDLDLGGESGFELAEQLHRAGSPAPSPVVLISTHAAQDFAELIEMSPAVGFVSKSALSGGAIGDLVLADQLARWGVGSGDRNRAPHHGHRQRGPRSRKICCRSGQTRWCGPCVLSRRTVLTELWKYRFRQRRFRHRGRGQFKRSSPPMRAVPTGQRFHSGAAVRQGDSACVAAKTLQRGRNRKLSRSLRAVQQ